MATPRGNVENALKRRVDDSSSASVTTKKQCLELKSLTLPKRKLGVDEAKAVLETTRRDIKSTEQEIRTKQKEAREFKKKLREAEKAAAAAETKKSALERKLKEVERDTETDACRIVRNVTEKLWGGEAQGENSVDDILLLRENGECTMEQVLEVATKFGALAVSKGMFQKGALRSLLKQPDNDVQNSAVAAFCSSSFESPANTHYSTWPLLTRLVAKATYIDTDRFERALFAKAEQVKKDDANDVSCNSDHKDKCFVLDLLVPCYEALPDAHCSKQVLGSAIQGALRQSVSSAGGSVSHAMPAEAAIAAQRRFPDFARFLSSPTEVELLLNLTKQGRMDVHRLIDEHMDARDKLQHSSRGTGHARILVVTKKSAMRTRVRQKRVEQHKLLLAKMSK